MSRSRNPKDLLACSQYSHPVRIVRIVRIERRRSVWWNELIYPRNWLSNRASTISEISQLAAVLCHSLGY